MTKHMNNLLKRLEQQSCSEASAIAECLRDIAENGDESDTDDFLIDCAKELRDWAQFVIDGMNKTMKEN